MHTNTFITKIETSCQRDKKPNLSMLDREQMKYVSYN